MLPLVVAGLLLLGCGDEVRSREPGAAETDVETEDAGASERPEPDQPDQPTDQNTAESAGEPDAEDPTADEPAADEPAGGAECGFLECVDGLPPGVEGSIPILTPGPSCLGDGGLRLSHDDPVQGDAIVVCLPSALDLEAPSALTIAGPSGVVVDATLTGLVLRAFFVDLVPGDFPVGSYDVRVQQQIAGGSAIDETLTATIGRADSPRLLVEQLSAGEIEVWLSGEAPNSEIAVDFYLLSSADAGCVYRGSSPITTDGDGVGSAGYDLGALEPGGYYAFSRTSAHRTCNFPNSDFTAP